MYEFVFTESPGWVEVVTFQSIQSAVSYLVSHRLSANKPSLRTVSNRFLVPCSFSQFLGFVCTFFLSPRATCPMMEAPLCGLAGRCRISPPRFLAECCKRQLNHGSFVLLYFRLSTFSDLYWVCSSVISCTVLFVSISQLIGCEDDVDRYQSPSASWYEGIHKVSCSDWPVAATPQWPDGDPVGYARATCPKKRSCLSRIRREIVGQPVVRLTVNLVT